jgi:carbamoyltransferase
VIDRVFFPHSLGLLYLAITQYLGFKKYGDEFKVMGLAPYGSPTHVDALSKLLSLEPEGGFSLSLEYFRHWTGEITMSWDSGEPNVPDVYSERLIDLLGPARRQDESVASEHENIAASVQRVFEEAAFHVLRGAHARIPSDALCLAGGCAMNSVANGKIRQHTPFKNVFIQPAAGDNGTALGAALEAWHDGGRRSIGSRMEHAYWGTEYDADAIAQVISASQVVDRGRCTLNTIGDESALCDATAAHLADGLIVGWFQGRMEWGARALGNRSILADPRRREMRDIINQKIKFRERFRPFAPSILAEAIDDYFVGAVHDPFMIQVYPVRPDKRDVIPAVTHVDGSGRLQSVSQASNARYWSLLRAFQRKTGVPVLLNTSFNENEPIVERPEQALDCFLRTDMDVLVMGPHILRKPR